MTEWKAVERRAKAERDFATSVRDSGSAGIEAYYPEIRGTSVALEYSNSVGQDLLPDLLTSEGVVVDLYNWDRPSQLVETYGVDREFLIELRESGAIILCANLELEQYEKCEWLYSMLADGRTIFRSIRTPAFFESNSPGFERRRRRTETQHLPKAFNRLGHEKTERLLRVCKAAHLPSDRNALCRVLSHWIDRLAIHHTAVADDILARIQLGDVEAMRDLRQWQRLAVSPHSSALGGEMKILHKNWAELFEPVGSANTVVAEVERQEAVLSFLAEQKLGVTADDFRSENWWIGQATATRNKLLDVVICVEERRGMLEAEGILRRALAAPGAAAPTRDDVRRYVQSAVRYREKVNRRLPALPTALAAAFGCLEHGAAVMATVGGATSLLMTEIVDPALQTAAEAVWPKVRLARLIRGE